MNVTISSSRLDISSKDVVERNKKQEIVQQQFDEHDTLLHR